MSKRGRKAFKHSVSARNHPAIQDLMQEMGYKGYFFWFALLEICAEEYFRTGELSFTFHKSFLYKELKCQHKTLMTSLERVQLKFNLSSTYVEPMFNLELPTLKNWIDEPEIEENQKSKKQSKTIKTAKNKNQHDEIIKWIVEQWNNNFGDNLSKVKSVNEARKKQIIKTLKAYPTSDYWVECFSKIKESDFLMGNSSDWKASFDFVVKENNFTKIIEDAYSNGKGKKSTQRIKAQENDDVFMSVFKDISHEQN